MRNSIKVPGERLRIVLLGYIIRGPIGGMAWHHLQYFMGCRDLGHDVYYFEDSGDLEACCYDPTRHMTDADPSYGLEFAARCFREVGLEDRWAYYDAHHRGWIGPSAKDVPAILREADLVINLSCSNVLRDPFMQINTRVLLDTDPGFTQMRNIVEPARKALSDRHNRFFSFGENIFSEACEIPDDGYPWVSTRQPIVLSAWPVIPMVENANFTTVMQWESYSSLIFGGRRYGMKSESIGEYLDLPTKCGEIFEIALGGASAPREMLQAKGWRLCDPLKVADVPLAYQRYIQQSKGEFSVAKEGYVISRSGWFSERGAAYLASGRPVLTQETGFSRMLPTGQGLLAFSNVLEAQEGVLEICGDLERHCGAARDIAVEFFEASKVLRHLIGSAMNHG